MPRDGPIATDAFLVTMCKWQMQFKHTFRQNCLGYHAGWNFLMKHDILLLTSTNTAVQFAAWSRPYMDILTPEPCGSNIVTLQYKRSGSKHLVMNGHHCISIQI